MKNVDGQSIAEIGDESRNGLYVITDTSWDSNGTLKVTVREKMGHLAELPDSYVKGMRRLARRALMHPDTIKSSRELNRFYDNACWSVTFAVSRLTD